MPTRDEFTKTMRIDLIPDVPRDAVSGQKPRVVISGPPRTDVAGGATEWGQSTWFQELLQNVYDAALIADTSGRIVDVNVRALEFFRYERMELCNLAILDLISGADESLVRTLLENLENERFTLIQAYCVRKDGSFFPAEIAVNKLRLGTMHLCFFVRDITLRRQAEEMLRTEHSAIRNSGNGIAVAGLDARLEYANPALAKLWGYPGTDALVGKDVRSLFSDPAAAERMVGVLSGEQDSWRGETTALRADGSRFDVEVAAARNRNADGEVVGIIFSFADISDRKRADQAEREAERNRVMLETIGAACHHLSQPAMVLLVNLGAIDKRLASADESVRSVVKSSIDAVERLGGILHKLNAVNEYKTTTYLERHEGTGAEESRILEIE
jgi:PAS domain S-box-containing protein